MCIFFSSSEASKDISWHLSSPKNKNCYPNLANGIGEGKAKQFSDLSKASEWSRTDKIGTLHLPAPGLIFRSAESPDCCLHGSDTYSFKKSEYPIQFLLQRGTL